MFVYKSYTYSFATLKKMSRKDILIILLYTIGDDRYLNSLIIYHPVKLRASERP